MHVAAVWQPVHAAAWHGREKYVQSVHVAAWTEPVPAWHYGMRQSAHVAAWREPVPAWRYVVMQSVHVAVRWQPVHLAAWHYVE